MDAGRAGRRTLTTACAAVLALTGAVLVWTALTAPPPLSSPPPRQPTAVLGEGRTDTAALVRSPEQEQEQEQARHRPSDGGNRGGGVRDLVTGPTLPESRPVRVEIPGIGVSSGLVELGLDAAGSMEVPQDPAVAGWYDLGPTPGALGPAVIAGHVSWDRVPAVFFRLQQVRRGDRVVVSREDGTDAVFAVTRVARFAKTRFPTRSVFGSIDHAGLRLITCGGAFDASNNRYLDNVVVFARLLRG